MIEKIFPLLSLLGIIISLIVSAAGIIRKKPAWLVAGAVLAIPFALYIRISPIFMGLGIFLPLFYMGAAAAIYKRVTWLAWLLLIPSISSLAGWWLGSILLVIVLIYISRKLIRCLMNGILKDNNKVIISFTFIVLLILLNIVTIIVGKSDPLYVLFLLFVNLPISYLVLLVPALIYLCRNAIRSTIDSILKSDMEKNIVSSVLIILLVFFINATFKHFFWEDIMIGRLYLSGPPYDRIVFLLVLIVFPIITAIEIWNKTKNIANAFLSWILTVWVFILISFPEPKFIIL